MKLFIFYLFCSISILQAAESYAQNARLSLNVEEETVANILQQIENASDFDFFYNNSHVDLDRRVSVSAHNSDIFTILNEVFEGTEVHYTVLDKKIILSTEIETSIQRTQQQNNTVKGKVIDIKGEPIIGATVKETGTNNGAITDINGLFSIGVKANASIEVSFVGYKTETIKAIPGKTLTITLKEDNEMLDEVVVTALGIKREEKALGYAVQKVNGDKLTTTKGVDIASSLTGKIAGLNIQNSTEFNENAKILLRGETPIVIVDGIPYDNIGLDDIAPDDIESIDVLKGATASALYGARGSSGAIMITTKKGTDAEGLNISINSNTMFFSGYLAFPETQSSYSRGQSGKYGNDYVWGDKLDIGRTAILYNPYTYEWEEQELVSKGKDNYKNFLQFSFVTNNNVSVSQKGKYGSFRASMTQIYNRGQYPNQDLNKVNFTVGGEMSWKKFKLEASATYNKHKASNNNGSGYSGSYIYDLVIWGSSEYDIRDFRNYWVEGKEDVQQNWYDNSWYDNPWFKSQEVVDAYDTDLMNAAVTGSYEITPWLKAMIRGGLDMSTQRNEWRNAKSANYAWDKNGFYGLSRTTELSLNTDAMLLANKSWGKFTIDGLLGGNIYYYRYDQMRSTTAGGLSIPGYYSLKASVDPVDSRSSLQQKRVNSLYGKLSLSWDSTY